MVNATEEQHVTAVLTQLNGGRPVSAVWQAWDLDELTDPKPAQRIEVCLLRRSLEHSRVSSGPTIDSWRIEVRIVADTVSNARVLRAHIRAQLEDTALDVAGTATTPICYEGGDVLEPDNEKFWSAYETWTYTH